MFNKVECIAWKWKFRSNN